MKYLANTFSLGMVEQDSIYSIKEIDEAVFTLLKDGAESHMDNKEIAAMYNVEISNIRFTMKNGDVLLVAQKMQGKLKFFCIKVLEVI